VCVSFETPGTASDADRSWERAQAWNGPLLTDATRALYRALFVRRSFLGSVHDALFRSRRRVAESSARGFGQGANLAGDGLMLGGVFVVDKGGRVLMDQRAQFIGDDAPPEAVLAALRTAAGARGGAGAGGAASPGKAGARESDGGVDLPPSWARSQLRLAPKTCAVPACMM
jgi:hypothetical protein